MVLNLFVSVVLINQSASKYFGDLHEFGALGKTVTLAGSKRKTE